MLPSPEKRCPSVTNISPFRGYMVTLVTPVFSVTVLPGVTKVLPGCLVTLLNQFNLLLFELGVMELPIFKTGHRFFPILGGVTTVTKKISNT